MMANIVAMFHSALHMDDGYVNHIAIVQDVDGYHNHFLYDEDKGKGAAGTGPFKTIEDAKQDVIAHYPDAKEKKISPAGYRYPVRSLQICLLRLRSDARSSAASGQMRTPVFPVMV